MLRFKYLIMTVVIFGCSKQINRSNQNIELCIGSQKKAIELAEKEWLKVYGNNIYIKKPFIAKLRYDSIWVVEGTLNTEKGGVPYIEINANNCSIIKMTHGK